MRSRVAPSIVSKLAIACLVAATGCDLLPEGHWTAPTNGDAAPQQPADSGAVTNDDAGVGVPGPDAGAAASPDAGGPSVGSDAGVAPTSDAGASSPAEDAGATPSLDGGPALAVCGNGVVEAAEACDDGSQNGLGACLVSCACRSGYRSEGGACLDVDECATDNGGCGDARYTSCTNHVGAPQTCASIDLCATNNGGCGDARYYACTNRDGAPQTCAGVDLCATNNGGCGSSAVFACSNTLGAPPTCAELPLITLHTDWLTGSVAGLAPGDKATITLGNDGYLASRVVAAGESYTFSGIPDGTYFLKIDLAGHTVPQAKRVVIEAAMGASFALDLVPGVPALADSEPVEIDFSTTPLPTDVFTFHWEEDASRSGRNQTAYVNQPPVVQFLAESVPVPDLVSADRLAHDYNIILSDESKAWDQEHAYRLLETLKEIPQRLRVASGPQDLVPSKWVLTTANLAGDIQVQYGTDGHTVLVSDAVFTYATPRMVSLDGARGSFFSRRLHHALVRWVTRDGSDAAAVDTILTERYGCSTHVSDYAALTAPTTGETAASFQAFHPSELVLLINMFEEMPQGYHAVTGLKYLVRRRDGVPHPIYPLAPAVAWALPALYPNGSYIEFMESGFTADPDDVHRLILHEKSHFLWGYVFSSELKQAWCTLGGWYADPTARSGWSTTLEVEFVSAYAHEKNPNEDMAESLAYYVLDPDALRSRSLPKYEFIRDRVMHGARYLATLPSNLTFQVLNLHPDYTYPGKIKTVDITVTGAPTADKVATIEIQLNTAQNVFAGASNGNLRLYSPIGTYLDVWLYPTTEEGTVLRGVVPISKYAKSGLWRPDQIVINDKVGNQRMEGTSDFGWRLQVDNALEDVTPPQYVAGSLRVEVVPDVVTEADGPHPVHRAHITWLVNENRTMGDGYSVHAYFTGPGSYSHQNWGSVNAATSLAAVDIILTDFDLSGEYGVPSIMMIDAAGNRTTTVFSEAPGHEPVTTVVVSTANPDTQAPEVSLNDVPEQGLHQIHISAQPTHPDAPDGETLVTIVYQARDDKSGLGQVVYRLLDPQGLSHRDYHYHDNFYTTFFQGDPTAWKEYSIHLVLPTGSAPGTWGLQELVVSDKAGNQQLYDFVEIMHFEVASAP